ncbi:MAG: hypothetical protein OER88_05355, partial [Planctomycetota bacterium]|nr:hypothetical protein [Planctomycetota bacterium]
MRALCLAVSALFFLAAPALALEVIELKSGRIIEAEKASVRGDNLWIELYLPQGKEYVAYAMPIEKVVPEYVFYIWLKGISDNQTASHIELAEWARKHGLFRQARKAYGIAGKSSTKIREEIPGLEKTMHGEEATWLFSEAERLFRANDVKVARTRLEQLLNDFSDTEEVGRAKALLMILGEREQFLSEQKKQEEVAARARKQRKHVTKQVDRVGKADRMVLKARL